ncbi:hypothetical protein [Helicobacter pylori]
MDFKKCSNFEKNVRFFISQIWFYDFTIDEIKEVVIIDKIN